MMVVEHLLQLCLIQLAKYIQKTQGSPVCDPFTHLLPAGRNKVAREVTEQIILGVVGVRGCVRHCGLFACSVIVTNSSNMVGEVILCTNSFNTMSVRISQRDQR